MIDNTRMRSYPTILEIVGMLVCAVVAYHAQGGVNTQSLLIVFAFAGGILYSKLYSSSYKGQYQSAINHRYAIHSHRYLSDQLDKQNTKLDKIMSEIRDMRLGVNIPITEKRFAEWDRSDAENKINEREYREGEDKELQEAFKREVF